MRRCMGQRMKRGRLGMLERQLERGKRQQLERDKRQRLGQHDMLGMKQRPCMC